MYRVPECIEYQSVSEYQKEQGTRVNETVDSFRLYPRVSSEESNTKPDTEETGTAGRNHQPSKFEIIMQKLEQMELQAWDQVCGSGNIEERVTNSEKD